MSLNSFSFILHFFAVLVSISLFQIFRKKCKTTVTFQLILLLGFSYYFILKTDYRFCFCVAIVTIISYLLGLWLEKSHNPKILMGGVQR